MELVVVVVVIVVVVGGDGGGGGGDARWIPELASRKEKGCLIIE